MLGVGQDDGTLGGPVEASTDATDGGTKKDIPPTKDVRRFEFNTPSMVIMSLLSSVAVVLVQGGAVNGPADCTCDKGLLDADPVHENGRQNAEQAHKAEDHGVSGIDLKTVWSAREITKLPANRDDLPGTAQEHHQRRASCSHSEVHSVSLHNLHICQCRAGDYSTTYPKTRAKQGDDACNVNLREDAASESHLYSNSTSTHFSWYEMKV